MIPPPPGSSPFPYTTLFRSSGSSMSCSLLGPVVPSGVLRVSPLSRRSEEHTSELQSHLNLVCRLLLEKKNSSCSPVHSCPHRHHSSRASPCWLDHSLPVPRP